MRAGEILQAKLSVSLNLKTEAEPDFAGLGMLCDFDSLLHYASVFPKALLKPAYVKSFFIYVVPKW